MALACVGRGIAALALVCSLSASSQLRGDFYPLATGEASSPGMALPGRAFGVSQAGKGLISYC